jgi:uncharacterized membrane-anchored protein
MKRGTVLVAFCIVALVQCLVPAGMIARREFTLRYGRAYKFRTAPVDPYDAFRGRYVWLAYEQDHARFSGRSGDVSIHGSGYGAIRQGADGFAVIDQVSLEPPKTGDYINVVQLYPDWKTKSIVHFRLPADRFYMEETAAPEAERVYRERNRWSDTNHTTYATIRIRNGEAVLENLFIDDRPISEFIREQPK